MPDFMLTREGILALSYKRVLARGCATFRTCAFALDVYSYDEDDMVLDPKLAEHLAHFGINIASLEKVSAAFVQEEPLLVFGVAFCKQLPCIVAERVRCLCNTEVVAFYLSSCRRTRQWLNLKWI